MPRKSRKAYIISYFPDDQNIRARRYANHQEQIEYFGKNGFELTIVAQNYQADEFSGMRCIRYAANLPSNLPPGAARNLLLDEFYKSDDTFAVFADDDAIIDNHGAGLAAVTAILDNPADFAGVDLVVPINPRNQPFNKLYREEADDFAAKWRFRGNANIKGSLMVLRNYKKDYGVEYKFDSFFDTASAGGFLGGEDGDLALQLIRDGRSSYTMQNCVLKEFGGDRVSTWAREPKTRNQQQDQLNEYRMRKYGAQGLKYQNGQFNWKAFWQQNSELLYSLDIPR